MGVVVQILVVVVILGVVMLVVVILVVVKRVVVGQYPVVQVSLLYLDLEARKREVQKILKKQIGKQLQKAVIQKDGKKIKTKLGFQQQLSAAAKRTAVVVGGRQVEHQLLA